MQFKTLSPTKGSGDQIKPNTKKITNTFINKSAPDEKDRRVEITVPAENFEFPQVESIEDYLAFAGSESQALEFLNTAIEDAAVSRGLAVIRTATTSADGVEGGFRDVISLGLAACKDWTPKATLAQNAKDVGLQFIALRAGFNEMSDEEKLAKMSAILGV